MPLGTTTTIPPTPKSFTENPDFVPFLQRVVRAHAVNDPLVQSDALTFASPAGATLFNTATKRRAKKAAGIGGANFQGGTGGGGVGGWVHVYDQRGVPAFGRIADTEDIIGSLYVDGRGQIVDKETGGKWEENRMYRLLTGERGVCRLSSYLRDKVREALKDGNTQ